jgi:hypothetical protein
LPRNVSRMIASPYCRALICSSAVRCIYQQRSVKPYAQSADIRENCRKLLGLAGPRS